MQGRELRGALHHLAWLSAVPLPVDARAAAEADLRFASASMHASSHTWAALSALHHAAGRHADAYAAALEALRTDVFGRRTDNILMRLTVAAFDSGRDADVRHWCGEVLRRSPGRWHGAQCALLTYAFRGDVSPVAIEEIDADVSREPADVAEGMAPKLELLRAAVHASNGHRQHARSILARIDARIQPTSDLPHYAAMAYAQLGEHEHERARELLQLFIDSGGPGRATVVHSRWFAPLQLEEPAAY